MLRIDHVFLGGEVEALEVQILRGPLERVASDHLPLAVDIAVARGTSGK